MEFLPEASTSNVDNESFPLHHQSQDQDYQSDPSCPFTPEENQVYLQLLQVVSTSDKVQKFESISSDLINRLDESQGASLLHYSCINGNIAMVTYLLEIGAEVNIWDKNKKVTPLICAAFGGYLNIVTILLEHNYDVNEGFHSCSNGQYSALYWAAKRNHHEVFHYLLQDYVTQNPTSPFRDTPIAAAVMCSSPDILQMLLAKQEHMTKADSQMGSEKNTPLHLAASGRYGHALQLCKILLEDASVNVNSVNVQQKTPLHLAAVSKREDIVTLLLSKGANVNVEDEKGRTPLFSAICSDEKKGLNCIKALIHKGSCNVNHQDKVGCSPLHLIGNYGLAETAEYLLMNGADFSIRTNSGKSALSCLRENIPTTPILLKKAFDQAVKLSSGQPGESHTEHLHNCEVEVDFKYVLPSSGTKDELSVVQTPEAHKYRSFRFATRSSIMRTIEENKQSALSMRKETSKMKCLVEEEYSDIMVHPVIHSFLDLKWKKLRFIFSMQFAFKIVLVILFSTLMQIPYIPFEGEEGTNETDTKLSTSSEIDETPMNKTEINCSRTNDPKLPFLKGMYVIIAVMATINALIELLEIFRAPRQQLRTLHPWISAAVWLMIVFHRPTTWDKECEEGRSLAAFAILLAWIDIWIEMSRLPQAGISIRIFLRVFKNFFAFIMPHFCLLFGFVLSLSLGFHENREYQSPVLALTKLIRVMAGDITMITDGVMNKPLNAYTDPGEVFHQQLLVYIYTGYVVIVAIVLMNLLIGLAVNDLQGICKGAAVDKLVKQTILLNTLETSFSGHWTRTCLPKGIFSNYINLFSSIDSSDKIITFNPYDPRDPIRITDEHKKELLNIGVSNRETYLQNVQLEYNMGNTSSQDNDQQTMKDYYEKLKPIMLYFESRMSR